MDTSCHFTVMQFSWKYLCLDYGPYVRYEYKKIGKFANYSKLYDA